MRNYICRNHVVKTVVLGAALTTLAAPRSAHATPSTLGFYPATDIYGNQVMHLDVDTYGRGIKADSTVSTGLTYGIGNGDGVLGRSEFGFDYLLSAGGATPAVDSDKRFLFNAKTQLFNSDANGTRVVAGVWGLGDKSIGAPDVGYITGSKTFSFGRIHLGVANAFAGKGAIALGTDNDNFNITAGYDKMLTPKLQFAADYYSGKSNYAGVQPTLYYFVNPNSDFGLGLFHLNSSQAGASGVNRNQVYICFDYNFGKGTEAAAAPAPAPAPAPAAKPAAP